MTKIKLPLAKNVPALPAKSVLMLLTLATTSFSSSRTTLLVILNEEFHDIIKVINALDFGGVLKCVIKTFKKKQKAGTEVDLLEC